jgi:hypothetical protein
MDVTADEGLKTLAVGELYIEPAAVAFNAAEGIELPFVSLVVKRTEVSPVDLETISGTGFDTHIGTWRFQGPAHHPDIFLENGPPAGVTERPYSLGNDNGTGAWTLFQEFPDNRLEGIQFAVAGFAGDRLWQGTGQVLSYRLAGYMKLDGYLPDRQSLLVTHPVDGFDCLGMHHHWFIPPGVIPL